jgi:hypothetical protein
VLGQPVRRVAGTASAGDGAQVLTCGHNREMINIQAHIQRHPTLIEAYEIEAVYEINFEDLRSVRIEIARVLHGPDNVTYFANTYVETRAARYAGVPEDRHGLTVWARVAHHYADGETHDETVMNALARLPANLRQAGLEQDV